MGSFTFSARQRLREKAQYDHVYKRGQRHSQTLFQATTCANSVSVARLGLSIASKAVGNAVSRNRIRRAVREAFRHLQHELPATDIIISARPPARTADGKALRADLEKLLRRIARAYTNNGSP